MWLVTEYYDGERRIHVERKRCSPRVAMSEAKEGLTTHGARFARVLQFDDQEKLLGMVHCDVKP